MKEYPPENEMSWNESVKKRNATWMYCYIIKAIKVAFKQYFSKVKERKKITSPFDAFCKKHINHPDIPMLIRAEQEGATEDIESHVQNISRDGWREHSAGIRVSDTKASFSYLAKADGRVPTA